MIAMTTNLKQLRQEIGGISQENFARVADLQSKTYRFAEWGRRVHYSTASKILIAMNKLRAEKGLPELALEDLGLEIS